MVKADRWLYNAEKELEKARENGEISQKAFELLSELRVHQIELEMQNEELKESQEELAILYHDYHELYNDVPVGYFILNKEGLVRNVNDKGITLLLESKRKIIGRGFSKFIHKEDENKYFQALLTAIKSGEDQELELILKRYTDFFYAKVKIIPLYHRKGSKYRIIVEDISERKEAEEALENAMQQTELNKQRLQTILETSPSAVVVVEAPDGRLSFMNKRALTLYGIDYEGVDMETNIAKIKASRPDGRIVGVDEVPASRALWNGEVVRNEEWIIYQADGAPIPVLASAAPIHNAQGDIVSAVVMFEDITERKKAEEELKKSEELYRTIVETAGEGIAIARPEGAFTFVNQRMADLLGYSIPEILGKSSTDFTFDDGIPQVQEFRCELHQGDFIQGEFRFRRKDGSAFWSSYNAVPLFDEKGKHVANVGMHQDITERKKAEEALRESEERLNFMLNNVRDAIVLLNLQTGRYDYFSPATLAVYGFTPEEMLAMTSEESIKHLHPDDVQTAREGRAKAAETGAAEYDLRWQKKTGEYVWLSAYTHVTRDDAGKPLYHHSVVRDITERKKVEEALKNSQELFQKTFHSVSFPISIVRVSDNQIVDINEAYLRMVEYNKEEVVGHTTKELQVFPNYEEREKITRLVRDGNTVRDQEIDVMTKSGKILRALFSVDLINYDNQPHFLGSIIDITERKKAEEALQDSEIQQRQQREFMDCLIYYAGSGIAVLQGRDLLFTLVNPAYQAIAPHIPMVGKTYREVFPEAAEVGAEERVRHVIDTGEPWIIETYHGPIPGKPDARWQGTVVRLPIEDGQEPSVISIVWDVTDSWRAEEALKEAHDTLELKVEERTKELSIERQRLFDVLETMPVMVCLLKPDYQVAFANRAFRELFGECQGRLCYDSCFGLEEPCEFCESFIPLKTGKPHHWQNKIPSGQIIDIYDFPFTDVDGSPLILEVDIDITEQVQAENDLKNTLKELKRSNKELEQFAYVSSHDLQEPLRTIASFTQLLERRYKGKFDSDADEFMDYIVEAAVRMKEQIEGLLEYSRIATKEEEFEPTDTNQILNQTIDALNSSINESKAEIVIDELPVVTGNSGQLQRVFQNLISNAIRFRKCEEPLKIHISANESEDEKEYVFSVQDNGIGIENEYIERIFTIFQKLHTRDVYKGTGIGLSIVKRIIERHGGRVWVESEYDVGSIFYFTIPV